MPNLRQSLAAQVLLQRRSVLGSLCAWAEENDFKPAQHHRLIIEKLEAVERGEIKKLALFLPPGSAKSTYTSRLFPPWFLARKPGRSILACSYAYTLAEQFGKWCRNVVKSKAKVLDYKLKDDSQSAGEWETTNNGLYFCAGVGAGIAGHRADLGLIDDPIGSQEDADSKTVRDKQWDWYRADFIPRLKPHASVVLIQTRRHEEDLAGRLLEQEGDEWDVVSLPMIAEDNDPLGRQPGELLWPDWFTPEMVLEAQKHEQTFAALYQQRPAPEQGDFFKKEWIDPYLYQPSDLPRDLRIYAASDHAISMAQTADFTVLGAVGVDTEDTVWVLPDIWWNRGPADRVVEEMLALCKRRKPLLWWAEKGHISKSLGPFLNKRMHEERVYARIEEVTPVHDKVSRAQAISGRMAMGKVRFPATAHWLSAAKHELLCFPHGKHDDFVDWLAHVGMGLESMVKARKPKPEFVHIPPSMKTLTLDWLKKDVKRTEREREFTNRGF